MAAQACSFSVGWNRGFELGSSNPRGSRAEPRLSEYGLRRQHLVPLSKVSFTLNRSIFLLSLIALGATYALPGNASPEQVDKVWAQAQKWRWLFTVNH